MMIKTKKYLYELYQDKYD